MLRGARYFRFLTLLAFAAFATPGCNRPGKPLAPDTIRSSETIADAGACTAGPTGCLYDVTTFGATGSCDTDTTAIQTAIEAAHRAKGGIVYFPPGTYCVTTELLGYDHITLRGASLGGSADSAASILETSPDFGPDMAVVRMADRTTYNNYGFQMEDLSISVTSTQPGIVGVDFSGVWFGAIRGVAVTGQTGTNSDGKKQVLSTGSIGFLFSDKDGSEPGFACFDNAIELTSVAGMDTGYRFNSTQQQETLNTLTAFSTSDVMTGVWTSSAGNVGLSFRDGRLDTSLSLPGRKAFKNDAYYPFIYLSNVQSTAGFDQPSDIVMTGGMESLEVAAGIGLHVDGALSGTRFTRIVSPAAATCGSTSSCPCPPRASRPQTLSFWASIPAGTCILGDAADAGVDAGTCVNSFTYETFYGVDYCTPLADLSFNFHPTRTANIGQVFQLAGSLSVAIEPSNDVACTAAGLTTSCPSGGGIYGQCGHPFQRYTITLLVPNTVTLTSDFVFFLEANTTTPSSTPGSCLYPPSL